MSSANKQTALAAHRAPRKRPFHGRFRRPGARVFWAFQRGADFSASPIYLEFSAPHRFTFPACPDSSVFPACMASSTQHCFVFPAHPELSALHRASRKRPFHGRSRWPEPRVFWAFQRGGDFYALAAHPALDASGALFRSAVLCSKRPSFDQPFGAHAS